MRRRTAPLPEPPTPAALELAARLRATDFPRIRYHRGYDRAEVDFLLRSIAETLERGTAGPELAREVARSQFHATTVRSGYDERSVDDFLDELTDQLRALLGEPPAEEPTLVIRLLTRAKRLLPFGRS